MKVTCRWRSISKILVLFLIFACDSSKEDTYQQSNSLEETQSVVLSIDRVKCEVDLFSSEGFFRVINGRIAFIQSSIENVLWFDENGKGIGESLGSGYGPMEAQGDLAYHGMYPNGDNLFLGSNYIFKTFNDSLNRIKTKTNFTWKNRKTNYNTLDLEDPSMYDYHYRDEPFIDSQWLPITGGKVVIPININSYINRKANLTKAPENFFGNAYTLGLVDLETGVLESVFRKHSKPFIENKWLYFYNYPYREVHNDLIYVSDRLGPQIEVYNSKTLDLVETFGEKGRYFNDGLDRYNTYEDFLSALGIDITLKSSYYLHIYMNKDNSFFFRSYHIENLEEWGLQIYDSNRKLIVDTRVPFRFNVIGKIGDFYYADGIMNEETNELAIYKFKINGL